MSKLPQDLKYTSEHEWFRIEGNKGRVGVTDFAQRELGDVVFVDLPEVGEVVGANEAFGTVESVKAVSDLYAPISGEVLEINADLEDKPELVNEDPYGKGWMLLIRMDEASNLSTLMDAEAYEKFLEEQQ